MDFIIADKNRDDIGCIDKFAALDFDVGSTFDFTITIKLQQYNSKKYAVGNLLYCLGTEYGGVLDNPEISTSNNSVVYTGDTPRGILKKKIIQPLSKSDYRLIYGELNECLETLISEQFDNLFVVSKINTGVIISENKPFQFDRYCTLYDGIVNMLKSVGYKLKIEFVYIDNVVAIELSSVPIVDYSNDIEFSQDCNFQFKILKVTNRYNYMIALGKGELSEREIIIFHLSENGKTSVVSSIPKGDSVKVYLYDLSNATDLMSESLKKIQEINKSDTYSMTIKDDLDIELHDIVGGRDYITGLTIAQPITNKIIKINQGIATISYEIGGNT